MLLGRLKRGELRVRESWIKTKKNRRYGLLNYTQVFYTSRGGGSEAPIRRMARWGLLLKLNRTSLAEKSNFNTRVCFLRLLLRDLYGPSHILTVLETGLKIQRFK